jgi:hypothetical protein
VAAHLLSDAPLPFGQLFFCQDDYREFACSKSTASWLMQGAMTHVDGKPVALRVKDECVGGHNVWVGAVAQDEEGA